MMPIKGKLGRVIFRKVGGRIVPIKISNIADKIADAADAGGTKFRKILASGPKGEYMGQLTLSIPKRGKSATVVDVRVPKEFRRKGISKNLFARAEKFANKAGMKFLRSDDLQHPAQVKIRAKKGRYKAGEKYRSRTKFTADQFGPYGEETRKINWREALDILKNNERGRLVRATTMLKKLKKK